MSLNSRRKKFTDRRLCTSPWRSMRSSSPLECPPLMHQGLGRNGRDAIFLSGISGRVAAWSRRANRLLHHPLDIDMKNRSRRSTSAPGSRRPALTRFLTIGSQGDCRGIPASQQLGITRDSGGQLRGCRLQPIMDNGEPAGTMLVQVTREPKNGSVQELARGKSGPPGRDRRGRPPITCRACR